MKTIYKLDSKGRLRVIKYRTDGDKLIAESGLMDGALVRNEKICKPKNVGRSNETSGTEQAKLQMGSKIALKTKGEYFMTEKEARDDEGAVYPMLAKVYEKEKHKIDWSGEVFAQPKLDGIRCLATVTNEGATLKSREGTIITTLPHLNEVMKLAPVGIYDGEIYAHGLNFQENMRLIKKNRGKETEQLTFHMYDMPSEASFSTRFGGLGLTQIDQLSKSLQLVTTIPVSEETQLRELHNQWVRVGYEGAILRHGEESYKSKGRSSHLLKYKNFDDGRFMVVDIVPMDARPKQGMVLCLLSNGDTFTANLAGTHAEREKMLTKKLLYIGKICNVRYFGVSETNIPRIATAVGFTDT